MAGFVINRGDVVVVPFPYSDLSGAKSRPALVIADMQVDDFLLCQITSQNTRDPNAIPLTSANFSSGKLPVASFIRPLRLFTCDRSIVSRKTGSVKPAVLQQVVATIVKNIQ